MSALSGKDIRDLHEKHGLVPVVTPYIARSSKRFGCSFGETYAGYDICLGEDVCLESGFTSLGVSLERFNMPNFLKAEVKDKSTLCRQGITVQNTVIEPGWCGYLTLEIQYNLVKHHGTKLNPDYRIPFHFKNCIFNYIEKRTSYRTDCVLEA